MLLSVVLAVGCTCAGNSPAKEEKKADQVSTLRNFTLPSFPSVIPEQEKPQYFAKHFWDSFFCEETCLTDTVIIGGISKPEIEQAMANYASLLYAVALPVAQQDLADLTDKAMAYHSAEASKAFLAVLENYIYDPNSPYRNEDFFLPVAERLKNWNALEEVERDKYARYAKYCSYNQIGTVAANFTYCDNLGRTGTLHGIKADNLLVFFSNPGCKSCKAIIEQISSSEKISAAVSSGKLKILNLYIDEDLEAWHEYMPVYPKTWINAYQPDLTVHDNSIYNIRAIPSLYILDRDKRVVMRDVPETIAINYLENL